MNTTEVSTEDVSTEGTTTEPITVSHDSAHCMPGCRSGSFSWTPAEVGQESFAGMPEDERDEALFRMTSLGHRVAIMFGTLAELAAKDLDKFDDFTGQLYGFMGESISVIKEAAGIESPSPFTTLAAILGIDQEALANLDENASPEDFLAALLGGEPPEGVGFAMLDLSDFTDEDPTDVESVVIEAEVATEEEDVDQVDDTTSVMNRDVI